MTRRLHLRVICIGVALAALLGSAGLKSHGSSPARKSKYSSDLNELRAKFNRDKGKVRLLMLLSPTCLGCLRGASDVQATVLDQMNDQDLQVYSVWVPILPPDSERWLPNAMKTLTDRRVSNYWDGKGELVEGYKTILPTKSQETGEYLKAWDVFLLFPRDAEWGDKPPSPSYWMHQLYFVDPAHAFNSGALASETRKMLQTTR